MIPSNVGITFEVVDWNFFSCICDPFWTRIRDHVPIHDLGYTIFRNSMSLILFCEKSLTFSQLLTIVLLLKLTQFFAFFFLYLVPSLPRLTPIPLQLATVSSRLQQWPMQWLPPTPQLRSRQPGLWPLPPTPPTRATRHLQTTPTGSPILHSPPLPHRRTRYTQTWSVSLCFYYHFCSSLLNYMLQFSLASSTSFVAHNVI